MSPPVFNASVLPQFHSPPMTTQRMGKSPAPREDDEKPLVEASTSATRFTYKLPSRDEMAQHCRRFWWACVLAIAACITAVVAPVVVVNQQRDPAPSGSTPVITSNFQDPSVIYVDGTYYGFAGANGNPAGINVQVASSKDFSTWTLHHNYDALPTLAPWAAEPGHLWSPDVSETSHGTFVMYYSASTATQPRKHCIGSATSPNITGPYTPADAILDTPLACPLSAGGAIDPDGFHDPSTGTDYMIYKVDGNSVGHGGTCSNSVAPIAPTPIMLQQVSSQNLTTPLFQPRQLLTNIAQDGPNIEAPALWHDTDTKTYYLAYSSGCFAQKGYTIRYATTSDLSKPFVRHPEPLIANGDTKAHVQIPGGLDVVGSGTSGKFIFQGDLNMAWFRGGGKHGGGNQERVRGLYAAQLKYGSDGELSVEGLY